MAAKTGTQGGQEIYKRIQNRTGVSGNSLLITIAYCYVLCMCTNSTWGSSVLEGLPCTEHLIADHSVSGSRVDRISTVTYVTGFYNKLIIWRARSPSNHAFNPSETQECGL